MRSFSLELLAVLALCLLETKVCGEENITACLAEYSPTVHLILPGNPLYDKLKYGENNRYDYFAPRVIISVTSVYDVQAAVKCARFLNLEINVMNGGHSFEGFSCTDGLLLNLDNFSDIIAIDRVRRTVTVQSGIRLARLYGLLISAFSGDDQTYTVGGGTCPTVGVTGHTLCGGYGLLGRMTGLASDQVISMEVVVASGKVIEASSTSHPDLFYALRGGCSSSFGVVVSLRFRLQPLPPGGVTVVEFPAFFGPDFVRAVQWWQMFSPYAPLELTLVIWLSPNGAQISGIFLGDRDEAFALLNSTTSSLFSSDILFNSLKKSSFLDAALWMHNDPSLNTLSDMIAVKHLSPERNHRFKGGSLMASQPLSAASLKTIHDLFKNGTIRGNLEFKAYGGASYLGSYSDHRSPLVRGQYFEAHYEVSDYGGQTIDAKTVHDGILQFETLQPFFVPNFHSYVGYVDLNVENGPSRYFGAANAAKLAQIRHAYDPDNIFRTRASDYLYPSLDHVTKIALDWTPSADCTE